MLIDDALRVRKAESAGTDVNLLIGRGMLHDWPPTLPWPDEGRFAWEVVRRFIEQH